MSLEERLPPKTAGFESREGRKAIPRREDSGQTLRVSEMHARNPLARPVMDFLTRQLRTRRVHSTTALSSVVY